MQKATGLGKMAWVALPAEDAAKAIAGREAVLALAAINDPGSVVLSGEIAALDDVVATLSGRGIECKPLKVNYAFHSPQMDQLARELVQALGRIDGRRAAIPLYSTVTGAPIDGEALDATYWGRNVREPVLFARAVASALADGHLLYLEIGPHPVLPENLEQCITHARRREGQVVFTLRRQSDERAAMLDALGGLYARGVDVDWRALDPSGGRLVSLPTYPWQRERYWVDALAPVGGAHASQAGHPLLGAGLSPADRPDAHYWEQWVSAASPAFLADHRVQEQVVFPGSGYVEMALSAAHEVYGEGRSVLEGASSFRMDAGAGRACTSGAGAGVARGRGRPSRSPLAISSHDDETGEWVRHAHATVREVGEEPAPLAEPPRLTLERCPTERSGIGALRAAWKRADPLRPGLGRGGSGSGRCRPKRCWAGALARRCRRAPRRISDPPGAAGCVPPGLRGADRRRRRTRWCPSIDRVQPHRRSWRGGWVRAMPPAERARSARRGPCDGPHWSWTTRGACSWRSCGLAMHRLAWPPWPIRSSIAPTPSCGGKSLSQPPPDLPRRPPRRAAPRPARGVVITDAGGTAAAASRTSCARREICSIEVEAGPRSERRGPRRTTRSIHRSRGLASASSVEVDRRRCDLGAASSTAGTWTPRPGTPRRRRRCWLTRATAARASSTVAQEPLRGTRGRAEASSW